MHYPLPPFWYKHSEITRLLGQTQRKECKKSVSSFFLLMFAEVMHTNWNLAWCMHPSILKWLISQLKPLNLILKIHRNAIYASIVHQFQGRYPTPDQPLQPLKAPQKNTQDLLNRSVTQRWGFRKETAVELKLLVQSDSKHLQHPSKHWGVLAGSHGQLPFGGLPKDNSGFLTEMPTEGHWSQSYTSHPGPLLGRQGQDHCWHLAITKPQTLVNQ